MNGYRWFSVLGGFWILVAAASAQTGAEDPQLIEVRKIWDAAPHNAFTDLVRFDDRWFCVFREGEAHVSPDGALRVIASVDGVEWESMARLESPNSDLRDAKITVTPAGELMLSGAEALHDRSAYSHQSLAWFSRDGRHWSERQEIGDRDVWLWRTVWRGDRAFAIGYGVGDDPFVRLYESRDGRAFETRVERLQAEGGPNETGLVFDGERAYCLLRRDGEPSSALLGTAEAPFNDWMWRDLGVRVGGPQLIQLPDRRLLAAVRLYDAAQRTSLCWLDPRGNSDRVLAAPLGRGHQLRGNGLARGAAVGELLLVARGSNEHLSVQVAVPLVRGGPSPGPAPHPGPLPTGRGEREE